jgi:hypothetical protein
MNVNVIKHYEGSRLVGMSPADNPLLRVKGGTVTKLSEELRLVLGVDQIEIKDVTP